MKSLNTLQIKYIAALIILFSIPLAAIFFPEVVFSEALLPLILIALFIIVGIAVRKYGRLVSRNTSHDSVLIFRYFFLAFWAILLIETIVNFSSYLSSGFGFWPVSLAVIVGLNILGIYLHKKSRTKLVKNIRKDELFQ